MLTSRDTPVALGSRLLFFNRRLVEGPRCNTSGHDRAPDLRYKSGAPAFSAVPGRTWLGKCSGRAPAVLQPCSSRSLAVLQPCSSRSPAVLQPCTSRAQTVSHPCYDPTAVPSPSGMRLVMLRPRPGQSCSGRARPFRDVPGVLGDRARLQPPRRTPMDSTRSPNRSEPPGPARAAAQSAAMPCRQH